MTRGVEIIFIALIAAVSLLAVVYPDQGAAIVVTAIFSLFVVAAIRYLIDEPDFAVKIFLVGLALRLCFGLLLEIFDARVFFGGDALTYDYNGWRIAQIWSGTAPQMSEYEEFRILSMTGAGWGMNYFVAVLYYVFGRSILLPQFVCAVIGAASAPAIYECAKRIFNNRSVAINAAILVAVMPAMIVWSGQLLKDGLVIFFLVIALTAILNLQEKFSLGSVAVLVVSLTCILSLRFYIFPMVAVAAIGSLIVGVSGSPGKLIARLGGLILVGVFLTYFGVLRIASTDIEKTANLERIQISRMDLARSAESGFEANNDVSTPEGALATVPIGLTYLFLAPFPWAAANLRQAITIPETLLWYATLPFIVFGIIYTVRKRLSKALPILIFTLLLTFAYSIFQGNVGTAYRQRTQIQVFLFMFAAVGIELIREKRQDRKTLSRKRFGR